MHSDSVKPGLCNPPAIVLLPWIIKETRAGVAGASRSGESLKWRCGVAGKTAIQGNQPFGEYFALDQKVI
jgi:hypothetical protein